MAKKRVKVFRWTETKPVSLIATLSASTWTLVGQLWHLDQDITVKLTNISGSFGLNDDPGDERVDWIIGAFDPQNLPAEENAGILASVWVHNDTWRSIGTDAGPTEVTTERSDKLDSSHTAAEIEDNLAVILAVRSSTTSATQTKAVVTALIEYRQSRYNNDEFNDASEEQHAIHS